MLLLQPWQLAKSKKNSENAEKKLNSVFLGTVISSVSLNLKLVDPFFLIEKF